MKTISLVISINCKVKFIFSSSVLVFFFVLLSCDVQNHKNKTTQNNERQPVRASNAQAYFEDSKTNETEEVLVPKLEITRGERYILRNIAPDWSPNGQMILFVRVATEHEVKAGICLYDLLTHQEIYVTAGAWPNWSPDNRHFVYRKGYLSVYSFIDSTSRQIFKHEDTGYYSDWGPDSLIVFESNYQNPGGGVVLWVFNMDHNSYRKISPIGIGEWRMGSWAPDGITIYHCRYVTGDLSNGMQIYTMDKFGNNSIMITNDSLRYDFPKVSPKGNLIAYLSNKGVIAMKNLWLLNLDNGDEVQATIDGASVMSHYYLCYNDVRPQSQF